ncbi:glycoside hydrolase family 30 protein [uncultured Dysgonomonas sp.]|uniref:O-Glycosyl hydrolase family 30 n=1 Tax=uncultured Dysgonomonas sp. TaxID=206096 RepID=A0A212JD78_9BACT|nr:glycoside hydrolase family 30 protein [uncultured Dysgonomonas sp.]SBV97378.1 conserved exported hypothetical protein [uncultured Dysgonomonas sp.]
MKKTNLFIIALSFLSMGACTSQKANWISTTADNAWQYKAGVILENTPKTADYYEIMVDNPDQTIEGFGTCFNELCWDAIQLVDKAKQEEILRNLFDPEDGLNFTFCRTSIAANDYSREWYSYNETDGDFEMKNFSIERDKETVIPFIKSALALNPDIKLWASPWSVPTWMKTNKYYANQSGPCNDLPKEKEVPLYNDQVIQKPEYLQALALYYSKYLDAYKKESIDISMIMYQNEAFTFSQWPNGSWKPQSIADFNMKYLGPHLAETHPEVEIYAGTFNTSDPQVYEAVLNHPDSKKYIKGVGVQWEGRDIFPKLRELYPGFKLMQSESECGWGDFSWKHAEHTFNLMKRYINGGANSYMNWNSVLKDDGSSTWCWKQNALIRIMSDTKEVIYTPEYYVYKHVISMVPNGSKRLPVESANGKEPNMLAFKTPGNDIILIAANYEETPVGVSIKVNDDYMSVNLEPKSFNTFVIK